MAGDQSVAVIRMMQAGVRSDTAHPMAARVAQLTCRFLSPARSCRQRQTCSIGHLSGLHLHGAVCRSESLSLQPAGVCRHAVVFTAHICIAQHFLQPMFVMRFICDVL